MGNLVKTNNKAFNNVASLMEELFSNETFKSPKTNFNTKTPLVNIKETEDDFSLEFSIPGIAKEDVKIELDNEKLTVYSESNKEVSKSSGAFTRREFQVSDFKRSFILPDTIDATKIEASQKNGILEILIPKKEEAKPKPIRSIQIAK